MVANEGEVSGERLKKKQRKTVVLGPWLLLSYWIFVLHIQKQVQYDFKTRPSDEKPYKSVLKRRGCFGRPDFIFICPVPYEIQVMCNIPATEP